MSAPRQPLSYSVAPATLIAADLIAGLNRLPVDVQLDIAPIVGRFWTLRLQTADGRASPLLIAFSVFVDRLVDEVETTKS